MVCGLLLVACSACVSEQGDTHVGATGPVSALKLLFPPYDAARRRLSGLLVKYLA